ncbi:MAG TPA: hypothetical protein VHN11_08795, partial [Xanthobacteraceae bacterium]|nr:hypothetical protein [Xanthobacteraceae bacterium]
PLQLIAKPAEIAGVIAFPASEDASYLGPGRLEGNCIIGTARPKIVVEEEVNRGYAAIDAQRNRAEA